MLQTLQADKIAELNLSNPAPTPSASHRPFLTSEATDSHLYCKPLPTDDW